MSRGIDSVKYSCTVENTDHSGSERTMEKGDSRDKIAQFEARRSVAIGVLKGITYDDIIAEAYLTIASHPDITDDALLRIAIRRDIMNFLGAEWARRSHYSERSIDTLVNRPEHVSTSPLDFALLTKRERECIGLVYWYGYTESEAAEALGTSQQNIAARLKSAYRKLGNGAKHKFCHEVVNRPIGLDITNEGEKEKEVPTVTSGAKSNFCHEVANRPNHNEGETSFRTVAFRSPNLKVQNVLTKTPEKYALHV